jgi:thioredoxin-like negative regulator of GroEL
MPLAIFRHKSAGKPDNVQIESHADWMELHEDFNTELPGKQKMIIAVTFHASWCKFCKKFNLKWNRKLVRPLKDTVKFASVEFGINQKLCKSLNVKQLPTVQFYCDGELLSSFPCVPKGFSKIQKTLQTYLEMDSAALKQQSKIWAACAKAKCETARQITAPATINNDKVDDGNKSIDTETLHLRRRKRVKRN